MKPELATDLSNQGGQLDVLTITTDSDAFNLLPGANEACTGTDQRGLARPQGGACEAGRVRARRRRVGEDHRGADGHGHEQRRGVPASRTAAAT